MSVRLGPYRLDTTYSGDCASALRAIPTDSFDAVITSPPYWGQRDSAGIGNEEDPRDYVAHLVDILAEALRCTRPSGTLWLNLGDAYNTPINWRRSDWAYSTLGKERAGLARHNAAYTKPRGRRRAFVDPEARWLSYGNLLALPQRVVLGLCDRGFLFRGEIVWVKARPMPEGVCRRPHRRHESIYVLAKSERHAFRSQPPVGSVWELVQTPGRSGHTSVFPIDLPRRCIEAAAIPSGGVVCDPFMGSGTTARAAREAGVHWIGFELDGDMCELANMASARRPGPRTLRFKKA
jgi:DNA modification methylase